MASTNVMGVTNPASDALGHWHVYGERVIYESPWVWLGQVDVEPPGGPRYWHHVVRLSTAAVIALLDDQERVLMLWRHRFVPDRWGWELPGGMVEDGEEPAAAANRELQEETGYRAGRVDPLVRFQPMPGTLDAEHHVFTGRDPRRVGEPTDLAEAARVEWVPLASIPALIAAGDISNAGSLVALPLLLRLALVAQAAAVCWPQGRSST
jgi:8-oxo-dGTP pyrophosphatase MutT (NUDIX family)